MKFENTTFIQPRPQPIALPDGAEIEQQIPQRPATVHSDVGVPFLQALITGAVVAALVALLLFEIADAPVLKTWLILTLAVTSGTWLVLLGETRRLLWGVERLTGLDLNRDGARGNPELRRLQVELKAGGSTQFIGSDWLEIDDAQLLRFARAATAGATLAEGVWGKDQATFPRGINQYKAFRSKLANAGLVRQVNPNNRSSAYELTPAGRAVFARLVEFAVTEQPK